MTRGEEIRNAIDTIIPIQSSENGRTYEQALMATGFEAGVSWADNHPVNNVWHDASEEPKEKSRIVIVDKRGEWRVRNYVSDDFDDNVLCGWKCCITYYDLKIWAYTDDLLPKGGEK